MVSLNPKTALRWAEALGYPAVFAGVLLYALLVTIPANTDRLIAAVQAAAAEHRAEVRAVHADVRRLLEQPWHPR